MSEVRVGIVGATGAVGQEMISVLERRDFPAGEIALFGSSRSAGSELSFHGRKVKVRELREDSFQGLDLALFSAGGDVSRKFAPFAVQSGTRVVDNSSAFRMDPQTPLVIPEINPGDLIRNRGVFAVPNCSTIILLMAVYPIHRINPVKKIIVSTYQATSGAGWEAMEELRMQSERYLKGEPLEPRLFPHPIAFNLFSHDSAMDLESGYNQEELKMVREVHKLGIVHRDIKPATCIRVPTFRAHAESIHLQLEGPADVDAVRKALEEFPGVLVVDDPEHNRFPMPRDASGRDEVLAGRIRPDPSDECGLSLFCCGDQLLKGAALNAVQIAEEIVH